MAEQHGTQPEHHAHLPETEFYDRALQRLDNALRNIAQIEERLSKNLGRGLQPERRRPSR